MDIRPLHDRIVVKLIKETETIQEGIYVPDAAHEQPQEGEIVAVGKGNRLEDGQVVPLDVQVGDRILFGKYSGSDIKINGEEYAILRQTEVLGVLSAVEVTRNRAYGGTTVAPSPRSEPKSRLSKGSLSPEKEPDDDYSMLDLDREIHDLVPDAERWLSTPNVALLGFAPRDLLGTSNEGLLRTLLRQVKYSAIS